MSNRQTARQRGYSAAWEKARASHLRAHPLCVFCLRSGRLTNATVVDHIQAHKGDPALFWTATNWQSLCAPCHDRSKKRNEFGRASAECGVDGMPVDPLHHWNA